MKRWISSILITIFLCAGFCCLPYWNKKNNQVKAESSKILQNASVTFINQKKVLPPPPPEKKQKPKKEEPPVKKSIPSPDAVKKEEPEQEQPMEEIEEQEEVTENIEYDENAEYSPSNTTELSGDPAAQDLYKSKAITKIARKKTYPLSARSKGYEGKVKVSVTIDSEGEIKNLEIITPCEYDVLNQATVTAIQKASPFGALPQYTDSLTIIFVMDYSLQN